MAPSIWAFTLSGLMAVPQSMAQTMRSMRRARESRANPPEPTLEAKCRYRCKRFRWKGKSRGGARRAIDLARLGRLARHGKRLGGRNRGGCRLRETRRPAPERRYHAR